MSYTPFTYSIRTVSQVSHALCIRGFSNADEYQNAILVNKTLHCVVYNYVVCDFRETIDPKDPTARFFTLSHYKQIYNLYMRDDGTRRRWKLQLSLLILFLICIPQVGNGQVLTFFQLDSPICFTSVDIGLWNVCVISSTSPIF